MAPKEEIASMRMKAVFAPSTLSAAASAIPRLESSSACTGTPRELSVPKRRGA